jgi:hypothetical protein
VNGEDFFMPCLSYHLPTAEIRLFSPQTYHTLYGGHITVMGDRVEMYVDQFQVGIHIDRQSSNAPMVYNCNVSAKEMRDHGPYIRSALPQYERKVDCLGGWSEDNFKHWQISTIAINSEFDHYSRGMCLPNVATNDNKNLSSAQKELLLWHWKLGIGMQRIQELMRVNQVEEPDGATSTMDRVITPQIKAAANCPIPVCQ